jgi:RecB family endonuclease NucS
MASDTTSDKNSSPLYEKEVQDYLANNLSLLGEPRLQLVQVEYPVNFGRDKGRIDILARNSNGDIVVIEIKRGVAGRAAIGQLQSYMGVILSEFPGKKVNGIIVAADLDDAAKSALLVASVKFFKFRTHFEFECVKIEITKNTEKASIETAEYKKNYWEPMGGVISDKFFDCPGCKKNTRIVAVGSLQLCGLCGRKAR